jgi:polyhydroxyalkanoate synthesis regulator phasin
MLNGYGTNNIIGVPPTDEDGFLTQQLYVPMVYSITTREDFSQQQPLIGTQSQYNAPQTRQPTQSEYVHAPKQHFNDFKPIYPIAHMQEEFPNDFDEENFVLHQINFHSDTITSIALKYGVTEEDIKRLNRLSDLDIYEGSTLIIPKSDIETVRNLIDEDALRLSTEERKQKALITQFCKTFKTNREEARYYLSSNEWNMHDAGEEFKEDLEWEKQNKIKEMVQKNHPTKQPKKKGIFGF